MIFEALSKVIERILSNNYIVFDMIHLYELVINYVD